MRFFSPPLRRAVTAGVLALALAGCAVQGTGPSAVMLSGGGAISDRQEAASDQEPGSSLSGGDETPSFQELPSSSEAPPESGEAPAPPPSSPEAPSSEAPPPESSSQPEGQEEEPEVGDEEEPDGDDGEDEGYEDGEDDGDDGGDGEEDGDRDGGGSSDWEDLKVKYNGSAVSDSAVSVVARIVQNEMNSSFPDEAIKAQAVAAYTFVRYHNATGSVPSVGMKTPSDRVTQLVREVAGEQITYNGSLILATYCSMSAGTTTSSQSVWGSQLPYLVPVESEGDKSADGYRKTTAPIPVGEVQRKLENALSIDLDGVDPGGWFDILSYWDGGPYVNRVSIGGRKETTGRVIRENILGLRSAAFEVEYDKGSGSFRFTTYGYGHGVGMSQMGAKYYANQGWDHAEILEHYYTGATVG